ncbi:hypothetical protein GCM10027515_08250 [Schumannella luteola]|uniref:Uncharacterized membrane protein YhaH (DUF805 family) n=1 Tax=Schumannella luteola TaxID=472059 RepID=A0A852Y540_9MICO|nr:uncharacterized membrane protein YhaH (DUF805 family) [Schumannella luteola]TPX01775.1 DUF805 domain-containing protein [Schumannella luteola]
MSSAADSASAGHVAGEPPLWLPYYRAPFGAAIRRFFRKYADFSGRAGRAEYWWWTLASVVVHLVLFVVASLISGDWNRAGTGDIGVISSFGIVSLPTPPDLAHAGAGAIGAWGIDLLANAFALGTFIPGLAVTWRRLHDVDRAGGWFFISFIPLIGAIVMLVWTVSSPQPGGARFDRLPAAAYVPRPVA